MKMLIVALAIASQYSPHIMDRVITNRQAWAQLPDPLPLVDGYIATKSCDCLGEIWYLRPTGQADWETFLVTDCARPDDSDNALTWMEENNILVEVDYETAQRWNTVGRGIQIEKGLLVPRGLQP